MDPDDFLPTLNKIAQRYFQQVQKEVSYCPTCQPYDGGEYIWILGEETTLEEIFDELDVPERFRGDIANHITCDNCGASNFERYDIVGKADHFDLETQEKSRLAERKYGRKIDELQSHLDKYPSLALTTALGRKIYKEILRGNVPSLSLSGKWYRGRTASSSEVYESKDMQAPPIGRARDGRYHHTGQSVLYIADYRETAIGEVLEEYFKPGLVWIQEYEIGGITKILDLRSDWNRIGMTESEILVALLSRRLLDQKVQDRKSNWKPEYFVTRFIADCARLAGYNGISYSSTRYSGDNAIIFDVTTTLIKPVGDPMILVHKPSFNYNVEFTEPCFPF
ncbi:RES family NAD+ phosphorylase [Desulfosporosinus metallidurans]|uniref:RES domain-containing protein n=1 Tax=Desulfosporosinus metallidurans TaxID=1888891 RepID=A0A1Q8QNV1_9FIRM|nr:RES family NAD+ phosphorylase [Desulfosporosinus metallidurans]OLN28968.1 hypothetical protein DSOL_3779 [Desulfosporosinus metallidurans]